MKNMKKKISILLIALVMAVAFVFGANSCIPDDTASITENDLILYYKQTVDGETSIFSKAENYNEQEKYLELTMEVEDSEYDFNAHFKTPAGQKWKLYADREGREQIGAKIVTNLKNGENLFYLVVLDKNETYQKTFVVRIEKKYLVSLTFLKRNGSKMNVFDQKFTDFIAGSNGEIDQSSQVILPGGTTLADLPLYEEEKGYEFRGWLCEQFVAGKPVTNDLTFVPDIHAKTFDCELDAAGGFIADGANKATLTFDQAGVLPVPSRTGYIFKGWKSDNLGGIFTDENGNMLAPLTKELKNEKFTAEWEAKTITLTFDSNGGSTVNPVTAKFGTEVPAIDVPQKEGYTFTGWTPAVPKTMPAEDAAFVAGWKINRHAIYFDTDGGNTINPITQDYGTTIAPPSDPVRRGYTFNGWSPAVPETMPDRDVTVTAKWTINKYVVSFDLAGGKIDGKETYETEQDYNTKVAAPQNPVKTGYTFLGWLNAKGEEQTFPFTLEDENVALVADWKINTYKLTYKYDIEGKNDDVFDMHYGDEISHVSTPNKTGYEFRRWWATDDNQYATMPDHDVTFTAQWIVKQFTIKFDYAGGTLNGQSSLEITADYGSNVTAPVSPVKENYTFKGWTLNGESSDVVSVMPAYDVTYVAKWQINESTVTYMNDGVVYATRKGNVGNAVEKPDNPVKTGYTFKGWSQNYDEFPTENVTVEAVWQINRHKIVYVYNNGSGNTTDYFDYAAVVTPIENPVKEGYDFKGWQPALPATMPDEDITVTAEWEIHTHNVQFDAAGGTINGENTYTGRYDFGASVTEPVKPVKTGYTFLGWYTSEDKKQSFPFKLGDADITFIAKWNVNKYNITFDFNGGTGKGETSFSARLDYGATITPPDEPVREGFEFKTWEPAVPETMPDRDVAISAVWTKVVTLTLDANGGKLGGEDVRTIMTKYNEKEVIFGIPTRENYIFTGWATDTGGNDLITDATGVCASVPCENDTVLYAAWDPVRYTVKAEVSASEKDWGRVTLNGSGSMLSASIAFNEKATVVAIANDGYSFEYWTIGGTQVSSASPYSFYPDKNVTIVAKFKKLVGNKISNGSDLQNMKSDGTYYLANNITLSGNWTPIEGFNGTLDGRGFAISGLTVKETLTKVSKKGEIAYGLFAELGENAVVKNVKLMAVNILLQTKDQIPGNKGLAVGALVGVNNGLIENCHVLSGTVKSQVYPGFNMTTHFTDYMVGGLCGHNRGTITSSSARNKVAVSDTCDAQMFVGGLAGLHGSKKEATVLTSQWKITNSYSSATIVIDSDRQFELYTGQVLGAAYAPVSDCAAYGSVSISCNDTKTTINDPNKVYAGGFAGAIGGAKAERIYVLANVVAEGTGNVWAAGVAGYLDNNISNTYGRVFGAYVSGSITVTTMSAASPNNNAQAMIGYIYATTKTKDCLQDAYYGSLALDAKLNNFASAPKDNGIQATNASSSLFFTTIGFDSNLWSYANGAIKLKIEG